MKMRALITILIVLGATAGSALCSQDRHSEFFKTNQLYNQGEYEQAALAYEALIKSGPVGGSVYYNLGACYLKTDQIGRAILSYERARVLMPRDPDVLFNLGYAKDKSLDQTENSAQISFGGFLERFTGKEIFWAFAVVNVLLCLFLTVRVWSPSEWSFYVIIALGLLWLTGGFFGAAKWYVSANDNRAIVVSKKIDVRAGPNSSDTLLFQLHEGSQATIEEKEDGWRLIRYSPEKRGWTSEYGVESIRPLRPERTE